MNPIPEGPNRNFTISKKRILTNTVYLYLRMLLTIIVGLYASRVLLEKLGFEDYGIYNVVGGVIVLFSFLSSALNSATQRFLSVALGKKDEERLSKIFGTSIHIYILLSVLVFILAETVGLWFLNYQMNFPAHRMKAVNWVYHITIITFILNTLRTPYNASIISYEKMSFYAITSIFEAISKLFIIYLIDKSHIDQLIFYALLVLVISFILLMWYIIYCHTNFPHLKFLKKADKACFKEMFNFSGWSLFGSFASIGSSQGINILLNIFCGVLVNAGMGIANQVTNVVNQFVSNFQVAFQPQIVKGYASHEIDNVQGLVFLSSRISFYLLFIISIPFLVEPDYILKLWLGNVPTYASDFTFYLLIMLMIEAIAAPLYMTIQATGKIKEYQIVVSCILLLNIALAYICLKIGLSPITVVIIRCVVSFVLLLYRVYKTSIILEFSVQEFNRTVLLRTIAVGSICYAGLYVIKINVTISPIVVILMAIAFSVVIIYLLGINHNERVLFSRLIKKSDNKYNK